MHRLSPNNWLCERKHRTFSSSNQWFKNKVYLLYLFYDLSETKINDKKRREFRTKNDSKKFCRNRNLIEKSVILKN